MATTLEDLHPDVIHTHILPRLGGPSLSATGAASSALKTLCSDDTLWSQISRTKWPSITHPRVNEVVSTFPACHRSFFDDSFPTLTTDVSCCNPRRTWSTVIKDCSSCDLDRSSHKWPSELIFAVDIYYQNAAIYSTVKFTQITSEFLSTGFRIELNEDDPTRSGNEVNGIPRSIDLTVDEISGADAATLSHLKESVTLNWIQIDPTRKRSCNLSSTKPVSARQDWVTNETLLRYVTVLPGCDPNEIVRCRIQVVLGVGEKGVGLYLKEVTMKLQDLDGISVNGMEFLKITKGAIMEENNVRRIVGDDEQRLRSCRVFKEMKKEKKEWEKKKEQKKELVIYFNYVAIFVSFLFCIYFILLLLK